MEHKFEYFCKNPENIENYDKAAADNFNGWECHHRLETHTSDGIRREVDILAAELRSLGMYYDRPASELIFMKHSEHASLHQKGKKRSEETKKRLSEVNKGKHFSEETRNKISKTLKGNIPWNKGKQNSKETRKKISEANKGRRWFNNGEISIMRFECPPGFVPGRLI